MKFDISQAWQVNSKERERETEISRKLLMRAEMRYSVLRAKRSRSRQKRQRMDGRVDGWTGHGQRRIGWTSEQTMKKGTATHA